MPNGVRRSFKVQGKDLQTPSYRHGRRRIPKTGTAKLAQFQRPAPQAPMGVQAIVGIYMPGSRLINARLSAVFKCPVSRITGKLGTRTHFTANGVNQALGFTGEKVI